MSFSSAVDGPPGGRAQNHLRLMAHWRLALAGQGRCVLLTGAPEVDRSALARTLREQLEPAHGWLECRCAYEHRYTPWYPVSALLKQLLPAGLGSSGELAAWLKAVPCDPATAVPVLAELLALPPDDEYPASQAGSPEQRRASIRELLPTLLSDRAHREPLVLLVKDLQWADASTLELLKALTERAGAAPLLILFTATPDFQSPWPEGRVAMLHLQAGDRTVEDSSSREAIDATLSPADQRRIHEEIAAELEHRSAEPEPVRLALLGHHYAAAGQQAAAMDYAQRLALLNLQHGAYAEALGGLREALDGLATLPEGAQRDRVELGLQGLAIPAMMMLHGHADPALETAARRVVALADALGDDPQVLPVLLLLSRHYHYYSQRPAALALAQRHVALAERLGDTDALVAGLPLLAQCHQVDGGFDRSRPLARHALDLYDSARHGHHVATYGLDSGVYAHLVLFYDDWHFGYPDRSFQHARQALDLARRLEHANTISVALMYLMWAHQLRGERDAVLELGRETRAFCERHGISPLIGSRSALIANWAGDEIGASYALLDGNLGVSALLGVATYFTPLVAEVELHRGNHAQALALIDACLALADACNEGFRLGHLHHLKGLILWQGRLAEPAAVEQAFQRSLAIAREQVSPMQELITRTQWCRFIRHNGGDDTAMRQALGEVYGRFSEGFDTEPLREARAVLDGV